MKSCVFWQVGFESDEQEFSRRGVKSKKISSHPGRVQCKWPVLC